MSTAIIVEYTHHTEQRVYAIKNPSSRPMAVPIVYNLVEEKTINGVRASYKSYFDHESVVELGSLPVETDGYEEGVNFGERHLLRSAIYDRNKYYRVKFEDPAEEAMFEEIVEKAGGSYLWDDLDATNAGELPDSADCWCSYIKKVLMGDMGYKLLNMSDQGKHQTFSKSSD